MITEKFITLAFAMICTGVAAVSGSMLPVAYQTATDGLTLWEAVEGGGIVALLFIALVAVWRKLAANDAQKDELIKKLLEKLDEKK